MRESENVLRAPIRERAELYGMSIKQCMRVFISFILFEELFIVKRSSVSVNVIALKCYCPLTVIFF